MEPAEISQLITELEERVERLRSLYDQYFMGIERLEPTILRKDVDRRLWALRREQIRNTGLRFKLENTIQRYNTYQQYWQRIVREIENGTYQRDLGRAAARFGEGTVTAFGRRRQKMFEKGQAKKAERDVQRQGQPSAPPEAQSAGETARADPSGSESYDVAFDDSEMIEQPPLSLDLEAHSPAPKPIAAPPPAAPSPVAAKVFPVRPSPREAIKLTAVSPGTLREVAAPHAAGDPPAPPASPFPPAPVLRSPTGALPRPVAPLPRAPAPPVAPSPPRAPALPPSVAARPDPAAQPKPAPRPAEPRPPAPSAPSAPSAPDDGLSATRLRQIYGQYVEAKRKANESTAAITFEKVAANLRQTATQLQAKHKGTIDFEVVMKNGKPVLKPVVK